MKELFDLEKIEILIKINQRNDMLAQVELVYGILHIRGFRIMRSNFEDNMYIQPPSVRIGTFWIDIVRIDDREKWKDLENIIKNKYLEEVKRHNSEVSGSEEVGIISPEQLLDKMTEEEEL